MRFKELKQKLNEWMDSSMTVPGLNNPTLGDGSLAPFRVEDEQSRERINAFLKLFGTERYDCPKHALVLLRSKLNLIGLDFNYDGKRRLGELEKFQLTQFGGRVGMNDQGEFFNDDGISHRTGGKPLILTVAIDHVPNSVMQSPLSSPDKVQKDVAISRYYVRPIIDFGSAMNDIVPPPKAGAAASAVQGDKQGPYQPGMSLK